MKRLNSAWTGRAARSMTEAFGPHTDRNLQPLPQPQRKREAWFIAACLACLLLGLIATYWTPQ